MEMPKPQPKADCWLLIALDIAPMGLVYDIDGAIDVHKQINKIGN